MNTFRSSPKMLALTLALFAAPVTSHFAHAKETVAGEVKEAAKDVKKGAKKAARAADDKACPIVNGKAECALKKGKHAVENKIDEHVSE